MTIYSRSGQPVARGPHAARADFRNDRTFFKTFIDKAEIECQRNFENLWAVYSSRYMQIYAKNKNTLAYAVNYISIKFPYYYR